MCEYRELECHMVIDSGNLISIDLEYAKEHSK